MNDTLKYAIVCFMVYKDLVRKLIRVVLCSALIGIGTLIGIGACKASSQELALPSVARGAREGVYYSVFVRSFADSNGDGIGDLAGLTQRLDYLNDGSDATHDDLGITGLWLLPIFPSPSYHGYDVSDYCAINPEYGTMEDFEKLIAEAGKRGIAVILDFPCNHSSIEHPWFTASRSVNSEYRPWYYWIDSAEKAAAQGVSLNKQVWGHALWNKTDGGYYAGLFDKAMPDLNLMYPEVRQALKDAAAFWLKKGVAGFRLDAALHVFNKNKIPAGIDALASSLAWWHEFSAFCKSIKPDVYLVGEVWSAPSTRAAYLQALDSDFHFDMGTMIIETLKQGRAGKNSFAKTLFADYRTYHEANPQYIDAPFLTNHDQNRSASMLQGKKPLLKLAASLYILTEGVPFVYYGEELGMMGGKPDEQLRTPFLWAAPQDDKGQTAWITSKYNTKTVPLASQTGDAQSLVSHYRRLIRLKTGIPALLRGRMEPLDTESNALISYTMKYQDDAVFIVHNITDKPVSFQLPQKTVAFKLFYASEVGISQNGTTVVIAPYASAVFTESR